MGLWVPTMPFEKLVVIDARGHLLGRLASFVAKEALLGQKIMVVRCEELVISGSFIRNKLKLLMKRNKRMNTNPRKGPFHHRSPADMFMRVVRGMIPHKLYRGSAAFQRVKAVEGIPDPFESVKRMVVPDALRVTRLRPGRKFANLGKLAEDLGWGYKSIVQDYEDKRKERGEKWYAERKRKKPNMRWHSRQYLLNSLSEEQPRRLILKRITSLCTN